MVTPPLPVPGGPWLAHRIHVYPHHTDYGGIVWHGAYVAWLEELRVAYLHQWGMAYADLVAAGCGLPVVDLHLRYHRPLHHGQEAILWGRPLVPQGLRLPWEYQLRSLPDLDPDLTPDRHPDPHAPDLPTPPLPTPPLPTPYSPTSPPSPTSTLFLSAQVTLAAVNSATGKPLRRWPAPLQEFLRETLGDLLRSP